jgi:hypothetical protein
LVTQKSENPRQSARGFLFARFIFKRSIYENGLTATMQAVIFARIHILKY